MSSQLIWSRPVFFKQTTSVLLLKLQHVNTRTEEGYDTKLASAVRSAFLSPKSSFWFLSFFFNLKWLQASLWTSSFILCIHSLNAVINWYTCFSFLFHIPYLPFSWQCWWICSVFVWFVFGCCTHLNGGFGEGGCARWRKGEGRPPSTSFWVTATLHSYDVNRFKVMGNGPCLTPPASLAHLS